MLKRIFKQRMRTKKFYLLCLLFSILTFHCFSQNFIEQQRRFPRVKEAIESKDVYLRKLFKAKGLEYPPRKIYVRIFKIEKIVELWAFSLKLRHFVKVKTYRMCLVYGLPGPKRKEGDFQIPEGIYFIDRFNPYSRCYLSLGINYPNKSDRIRGYKKRLGGDIFIHGGCGSRGCIAITDDKIKELYWLAVQAKGMGQQKIPVHIFPCKMTLIKMTFLKLFAYNPYYWIVLKFLIRNSHPHTPKELVSFWNELKEVYDYFEKNRTLPEIRISSKGEYKIQNFTL